MKQFRLNTLAIALLCFGMTAADACFANDLSIEPKPVAPAKSTPSSNTPTSASAVKVESPPAQPATQNGAQNTPATPVTPIAPKTTPVGELVPVNYGNLDVSQVRGVAAQTLDLTTNPDDVWTRVRRGYAVPNIDTPLVQQWTQYYSTRPDYFRRTTERAGKYLFFIIEELERRGMPTELALLPFVESAFNPTALSSARASGLWQFIPSTGKHYKLEQNWWRDDRRDVIASTKAALDYLQYIYEMHGDWHLALASYNWGEGAVKRAIEKNRAKGLPTDYLSLDMPNETRNYVPKLQAVKNIIANPEGFRIVLPDVANKQYFATIKKTRDIDVAVAAKLAGMSLEEFKALNPSFNRPLIPGAHQATLLIPADRAQAFQDAIDNSSTPLSNWTVHTIGRGEGLDSIAARYGTSVATLKSINSLPTRTIGKGKRKRTVTMAGVGTKLLVPRNGQTQDISPTQVQLASASSDSGSSASDAPVRTASYTQRVHTVRKGETLFSISKRYGVTVAALKNANRIQGGVKSGSRLVIPGGSVQTASYSKPVAGKRQYVAKGGKKSAGKYAKAPARGKPQGKAKKRR